MWLIMSKIILKKCDVYTKLSYLHISLVVFLNLWIYFIYQFTMMIFSLFELWELLCNFYLLIRFLFVLIYCSIICVQISFCRDNAIFFSFVCYAILKSHKNVLWKQKVCLVLAWYLTLVYLKKMLYRFGFHILFSALFSLENKFRSLFLI